MSNGKKTIIILMAVFLLLSLVSVSVMGKVLYDTHETNRTLKSKVDRLIKQTEQSLVKETDDPEYGNADTDSKTDPDPEKTEYTYDNIKGTYRVEFPSPDSDYPYFLSLKLKDNGSFAYSRGSGPHDGIIGYYTIKDTSLILHKQFSTGMDVSLGVLDEGEIILTINENGSLTDSTRFVSDFCDKKSAVLKKESSDNPDIDNNNTIKFTAQENAIY